MLMWRLLKMYIMPTVLQSIYFVEKYNDNWDPKIHGPCRYLHIVYVAALIKECGTNKHYPLAMFRNGIKRDKIILYGHDGRWNSLFVL